MDIIIAIGGGLFMLGLFVIALNTRVRYGWFFRHYESQNRGANIVGILMILVGLVIMLIKIKLND